MGSFTYVDVVPFVIHNAVEGDVCRDPAAKWGDDWWASPSALGRGDTDLKEWVFVGDCEKFGKRKCLLSTVWKKGKCIIHMINEDPFAAGGGMSLAICAKDKTSLIAFIEDFEDKILNTKIEKDDAVQQTM